MIWIGKTSVEILCNLNVTLQVYRFPIIKMRWSPDHLILIMEMRIPIPGRIIFILKRTTIKLFNYWSRTYKGPRFGHNCACPSRSSWTFLLTYTCIRYKWYGMLYKSTVKCRYNAVQFITILHTTLRLQWQKVNQILKSQQTPHNSPLRASYGVPIVRILEKIYRVITAPHCT